MSHNNDYVTVLTTEAPCNKQVGINAKGEPWKKHKDSPYSGLMEVHHVPDVEAFAGVIKEVMEDECKTLILGYNPALLDQPLHLATKKKIQEAFKLSKTDTLPMEPFVGPESGKRYLARTKDTFLQSSWIYFDYDIVDSQPEELITSDPDKWWGWMAEILPGLQDAAYVHIPSTSSRVKYADGEPAFDARGWHRYVQVKDPTDVERFAPELLLTALGSRCGFIRDIGTTINGEPGVARRPWACFDPSVFSRERLVFVGKPEVKAPDVLEIDKPNIEVHEGSQLDTSKVAVTSEQRSEVKKRAGLEMGSGSDGIYLTSKGSLSMGQLIETEIGQMTVEDFWTSDHDKLRCDAFNRPESVSQAGFLGRHNNGEPFFFDMGTGTKFTVSPFEFMDFALDKALFELDAIEDSELAGGWLEVTRDLDAEGVKEILKRVKSRLGLESVAPLRKEYNAAVREWLRESKAERAVEADAATEAKGRLPVGWRDALLHKHMPKIRGRLTNCIKGGEVFNYGGTLSYIAKGPPVGVRQIQRLHNMKEEYPHQYLIRRYTPSLLAERILHSVEFYTLDDNNNRRLLGPPHRVLTSLLENNNTGKPLAGLVEAPIITPQGQWIDRFGYDEATGFYATFNAQMQEAIPTDLSQEAVDASLDYINNVLLADFPFEEEIDRTAAIAALLTGLQRVFMARAPGFMITATTQSSGKSTLAQVIFHVCYGRNAAAGSFTKDQEEMTKRIMSWLISGQSGVLLDNITHGTGVDGDELAKLVTEPEYQARILGRNEAPTLPINILLMLTGNMIHAEGDMLTRLLPLRLRPDCEDPDNRVLARPQIIGWLEKNRVQALRSVLTLLAAWHAAKAEGEYVRLERSSRFEDWDELVRKPMVWLGIGDPLKSLDINKRDDPVGEERTEFLKQWHNLFGEEWVLLKDAWDKIDTNIRHFGTSDGMPPFAAAAHSLALDGHGLRDSRHLGHSLKYFAGKIYDGYVIEQKSSSNRSKKTRPWRVRRVAGSSEAEETFEEDVVF